MYILHLFNIFEKETTRVPFMVISGDIGKHKGIRLLMQISIMLLFHTTLMGQSPYKVDYYTTEDGLPQNTVSCIIKDNRGFLWFGTPHGLCRFDGYHVKAYISVTAGSGINLNTINALCEDDIGNLWIGSSKGLLFFAFQQEKLTYVNFPHNEMMAIKINAVRAKQGQLWLATETGLYQCTYVMTNEQPGIQAESIHLFQPSARFNTIVQTRDYGLLFGSTKGIFRYDTINREIRRFEMAEPGIAFLSNDVRAIYEARDKSLWIGTFFGMARYMPVTQKTSVFFHDPENDATINHSTVRAFAEDSKGNLLIGALGGLDIFDPATNTFRRFSTLEQDGYCLNSIFVSSLCTDAFGNVWIGTDKGGLNYYNIYQKPFGCLVHEPRNNNSLTNNTINSIIEKDELLWIGTAGGGLNCLDLESGRFRHFLFDPRDNRSLSSNFVSTLFFDADKKLWIGTWGGGINILNPGHQEHFQHYINTGDPYSLSNNFVSSVVAYNQDYLVIGTEGGLNFFNRRSGRFIHLDDKVLSDIRISEVGCLLKDKKGNLWVGTRRGLFRFSNITFSGDVVTIQPGDIREYKETENARGLKGSYITTMIEDQHEVIWIGTYGNGINSCEAMPSGGYSFKNYSELNGLCNDAVYRIEEDGAGKLWISTDNGLSRFDPDNDEFKNFFQNDGLLSSQFYWSASYKNDHGTLYFGSVAGLNYFDPEKIIGTSEIMRLYA